jgi:hypothetical protein
VFIRFLRRVWQDKSLAEAVTIFWHVENNTNNGAAGGFSET